MSATQKAQNCNVVHFLNKTALNLAQTLPELGTNLHKYCSHIHTFFSSQPFISYCAGVHVEHIN